MSDNIGSISAVYYTLVDDVKNCVVTNHGMAMNFRENKGWIKFRSTARLNEVAVTSVMDRKGTYDAQGSVSIPSFRLKDHPEYALLNNKPVLIKYSTPMGDSYIIGDKENFLTAVTEKLSPSEAAGYAGLKIKFSGTLAHPDLPVL